MDKTTETQNTSSVNTAKKVTSKQIAAIIGIVLLVLLYVVTLIVAFIDTSASGTLFLLCLFATIAVPVLIWIYTWMYGKLTGRHTFADPNLNFGVDNAYDLPTAPDHREE